MMPEDCRRRRPRRATILTAEKRELRRDSFALWCFQRVYARQAVDEHPTVRFARALVLSSQYVNTATEEQIDLWEQCLDELAVIRRRKTNHEIDQAGFLREVQDLFARHFGGMSLRAWEIDAIDRLTTQQEEPH